MPSKKKKKKRERRRREGVQGGSNYLGDRRGKYV